MKCTNCGADNPNDSKFCGNCGIKISTDLSATYNSNTNVNTNIKRTRSSVFYVLIATAFVLCAGIAVLYLVQHQLNIASADVNEDEADSKNYDEYFDYVLVDAGEYIVGTSRVETVNESYDLIGVLDSNCKWVIEPTRHTFLTPDGELSVNSPVVVTDMNGYRGKYISTIYTIQERLHYAGNGIFVYAEEWHNGGGDSWLKGKSWDVKYNHTFDTGNYQTDTFTMSDGYVVWAGVYNDSCIRLLTPGGSVKKLESIHCSNPSLIGQYSEGMFFAYGGFWDIDGNLVIDLSEYGGTIINQPQFHGDSCTIISRNPNGVLFSAVIDKRGEFISDFERME